MTTPAPRTPRRRDEKALPVQQAALLLEARFGLAYLCWTTAYGLNEAAMKWLPLDWLVAHLGVTATGLVYAASLVAAVVFVTAVTGCWDRFLRAWSI